MPAPRVVLATRTYPPDSGAAPFRLRALVTALRQRGADVEVLTTRPARGADSHSSRRVRRWGSLRPHSPARVRSGVAGATPEAVVRRWPALRDRSGRVRGYLPYASFDLPLALRLLATARPDVVVVEPPPTTGAVVRVVARLRGVPYAYYAADVLSAAARSAGTPAPVLRALRALEGFALRGAVVVLTTSPGMAAELTALGADPARTAVVGTGADTDLFTPDGPRARGPRHQGPLLVYAGTMSEVHGAGVFVDAFASAAAQVPDARLVVLGDGADRPAMQQRAEQLAPGRVDFRGQVPGEEVARWLRCASAGLASVRPGSSYEFAYATKAFAVTGCGAPVLYAGPGPCADLVREGRLGWAVPWDVDAVAAAMVAALRAPRDEGRRAATAAWTRANASLTAVAARAAEQVLQRA